MAETQDLTGAAAKREMEATAWAVALAAPGIFAGISQVGPLFRASRFPWAFGYVFGTMEILLLLAMVIGISNYRNLSRVLGLLTAIEMEKRLRAGYQEWLDEAWKKRPLDQKRISELQEKVKRTFTDAPILLDDLASAQKGTRNVATAQLIILETAYWLFIAILLTSNFWTLL